MKEYQLYSYGQWFLEHGVKATLAGKISERVLVTLYDEVARFSDRDNTHDFRIDFYLKIGEAQIVRAIHLASNFINSPKLEDK